jgi:Tol biopolymer transport system component
MKRTTKITILTAALVAAVSIQAQTGRTPDVQFKAAEHKEQVEGDLKGAIEQYRRIAQSKDRAIAVQALIRMAECHQKLGDAESRKIYEQVVKDFADQKEAVAIARRKLGASEEGLTNVVSSRRVWTAPPKADFYGLVSPNGRFIPYTDWNQKGDLFAYDQGTGTVRRLTDAADDSVGGSGAYAEESAFSRDSTELAYTWSLGKGSGIELRTISLQSTGVPQPRCLVANSDLKWIFPYDWSPDGKSIAAHLQRNDRTAQIALVSVEDGAIRTLKSVDWRGPSGIFFSPDGKHLAYDLPVDDSPTGNRDVFIIASDGSREMPAVVHPGQDKVVGWSPDGKKLLFASDRSESMALWSIGFADGKVQGPPNFLKASLGSPRQFQNLGITSSGAQYSVVYNPGGVGPDVQIAQFDFAAGRFVSRPAAAAKSFLGTNMHAAWSPDGKSLAYDSFRDDHVVIGIRSTETGQVRELVPSPNFAASPGNFWSLSWSPDGGSLVVSAANNKHGTGLFKIDAHTGVTSPIVTGFAPRFAVITKDGQLYYRGNSLRSLFKRDIASGKTTELIQGKAMLGRAQVSPDGAYVATVIGDGPSGSPYALVVMPAAGGEGRELIRSTEVAPPMLSPDGRYVATVVLDAATKSKVAMLFSIEGGMPQELMRVFVGASMSPDDTKQNAQRQPRAIAGLGLAAWAPDSRSVLLTSWGEGKADWWRVSVESLKPQKLEVGVNRGFQMLVSPDGHHVAIHTPASAKKPTEIRVMENLLSPALAADK